MKKKLLKILLLIIIIILIIFDILFYYIVSRINKINYVEVPKAQIKVSEGVQENLKGYRNVVLFGLDTREDTYEGSRSDCIIIASINEITKEIKLTSVYRDTYLKIPGYGLDKVNHSYSYGGATLTMSTLNLNLDLDITEFVTINFESTKEIIDFIGGVEIKVTTAEAKQISGIKSAGTYNLTGIQALEYGRIRKIDNDYVRTERMRNVVTAVFEKAKSMNMLELDNLVNKLFPIIYTNITTDEILSYIPNISKYSIIDSIGWPYETKGKTINGVWYGPPITLESNVIKLHKNLFNDITYIPTDEVKLTSKSIIDITGYR